MYTVHSTHNAGRWTRSAVGFMPIYSIPYCWHMSREQSRWGWCGRIRRHHHHSDQQQQQRTEQKYYLFRNWKNLIEWKKINLFANFLWYMFRYLFGRLCLATLLSSLKQMNVGGANEFILYFYTNYLFICVLYTPSEYKYRQTQPGTRVLLYSLRLPLI